MSRYDLSITEIVEGCSVDVELQLAAVRQRIQTLEQRVSQTQTQVERVRLHVTSIEVATRSQSGLQRFANDTIQQHRLQQRNLEPDVVAIEQQLETLSQTVQRETREATHRGQEVRDQVSDASRVTEWLRDSIQTVTTSQQQMETLRDEAEEMLDRLNAITRRQQTN